MPPPSPSSLVTPARLRRFGVAVALGLVAAFVVFIATARGVDAVAGGRVGGDWAAFHTAGILLRDNPASLLDPDAQRRVMAPYLDGRFAPFPYPPLFGYAYVPFTLLSFTGGYVAYVVALVALAFLTIHWTMDLLGVAGRWRQVGLLGGVTFAGTFVSIGGAQNTIITLFLLVAASRLLAHDGQVRAGLVLTLLWFKPQYAVPVLGLVLVTGRWRTVATALGGGVALAALTTVVFGPDWPARWIDLLSLTDAGNRAFNTGNTVSGVEWLRGTLAAPWGDIVGLGLAVALGIAGVAVARRHPAPTSLLPLLGLALLVTAPHALTYELALLVPALAVVARGHGVSWAVAAWLVAPLVIIDVPPLLRIAYVGATAVAWWTVEAASTNPALGASRGSDGIEPPGAYGGTPPGTTEGMR